MSFVYLDPRQDSLTGTVVPARRAATLDGKRVGVLWNNRPGGDIILRELIRLLRERHELADVYFTKKQTIGNGAPEDVLDDLVAHADVAIVGVGD
jgi:hypothetical protein